MSCEREDCPLSSKSGWPPLLYAPLLAVVLIILIAGAIRLIG